MPPPTQPQSTHHQRCCQLMTLVDASTLPCLHMLRYHHTYDCLFGQTPCSLRAATGRALACALALASQPGALSDASARWPRERRRHAVAPKYGLYWCKQCIYRCRHSSVVILPSSDTKRISFVLSRCSASGQCPTRICMCNNIVLQYGLGATEFVCSLGTH